MQCGICDRHSRTVTCGPCAQGIVWPLRTEFLFRTAERDAASEKVQEYLEGSGGAAESTVARTEGLRDRVDAVRKENERLKESIKAGTVLRSDGVARISFLGRKVDNLYFSFALCVCADSARIEKLRNETAARRRALEAAREAEQVRHDMLEVVKNDIRRINQKLKLLNTRTVEARSFLCREAAALYGLRLKRRRSGKVEYSIGGVLLPNLMTDLNGGAAPFLWPVAVGVCVANATSTVLYCSTPTQQL